MAAGVAQIPWYATLFRGDTFAEALAEIAPIAMRYGATDYRVYRNRDDMYKFTADARRSRASRTSRRTGTGRSSSHWRTIYSGWYQIPILYTWNDLIYRRVGPARARCDRRASGRR